MLVSGAICVYRINEAETAILEKMQHSNLIKDITGKAISQTVTCISFCETIPPKLDIEVFNEHTGGNNRYLYDSYCTQVAKFPQEKSHRFLAMGLSKGTVIFVPID